MPDFEDKIPISEFSYTNSLNNTDQMPIIQQDGAAWDNFRTSLADIGLHINKDIEYVTELHTTSKKVFGAINELADGGASADITTEITTSAPVQTFNDGGDNIPLKSLVTEIVPVQAGSGVPSPSNVRAISGHSDCTVTVSDGDSISRNTTIPLGQTVYGGSLECVEGKGQITLGIIDLGNLAWTGPDATYNRFTTTVPGLISSGTRLTKLYCSCYQTIDDGRAVGDVPNNSVYTAAIAPSDRIYIHDTRYSSASDFTTAVTGQKLVFPITPTSLSVSGANIPTLSGENNIYTDCGDIQSLEYFNENGNDIASMVRLMTRS